MNVDFWLVVGLGNPGHKYEETRHNVGFNVIDTLVGKIVKNIGMSSVSWQDKYDAESCTLQLGENRIVCAKPLSFMNRSGEPVARLQRFYKVPLRRLIVIHDELDLSLGVVRLKNGGGEAGHNGLRSIAQVLGSKDFYRVRVGIGRPSGLPGSDDITSEAVSLSVSSWVLSKFSLNEGEKVNSVCEKAADAIELVVRDGFLKAQNSINR